MGPTKKTTGKTRNAGTAPAARPAPARRRGGAARVTRTVTIPDPVRAARCGKNPELGPRILFFSGGTAIRTLTRELIRYTHNSIHLITPFDSGGSSKVIREAFNMLSVGDLRSRIMALADQSLTGAPEVYDLFSYRFPKRTAVSSLRNELELMAQAKHNLMLKVPNPMRRIIRNHLHQFIAKMPDDFDLRGASIGNLIIAAGYLNNRRHIEPVIYTFSKLVEARGVVRPITGMSYHLAARLKNGKTVAGQHLLTGKETGALRSKIEELSIVESLKKPEPIRVRIKDKIRKLIANAELICYPYGSYYTSLIANLLPEGVGDVIRENGGPKVFIPNQADDPEGIGLGLAEAVETLVRYLERSCKNGNRARKDGGGARGLLDFVVVDTRNGRYQRPLNLRRIESMGVQIIDTTLIGPDSETLYDPELVAHVLLSLT